MESFQVENIVKIVKDQRRNFWTTSNNAVRWLSRYALQIDRHCESPFINVNCTETVNNLGTQYGHVLGQHRMIIGCSCHLAISSKKLEVML